MLRHGSSRMDLSQCPLLNADHPRQGHVRDSADRARENGTWEEMDMDVEQGKQMWEMDGPWRGKLQGVACCEKRREASGE